MLVRSLIAALCSLPNLVASADSMDRQLVGRWRAQGGTEITFRRDHTMMLRNDVGTWSGTWRLEDNRLKTIIASPRDPEQHIDTCTFGIRGDELAFGFCEGIRKSHRHQIGESELYTFGAIYKRLRRSHARI